MRAVLLVAMTALALSAQPPTTARAPANAPAPELKPEDLCTLEGRVLNAAAGTPLSKATLTLMRADISPGTGSPLTNFTASTDAEGRFAMRDIEPGRYRLRANRTGFVAMDYNARSPNRSGTMLTSVARVAP